MGIAYKSRRIPLRKDWKQFNENEDWSGQNDLLFSSKLYILFVKLMNTVSRFLFQFYPLIYADASKILEVYSSVASSTFVFLILPLLVPSYTLAISWAFILPLSTSRILQMPLTFCSHAFPYLDYNLPSNLIFLFLMSLVSTVLALSIAFWLNLSFTSSWN